MAIEKGSKRRLGKYQIKKRIIGLVTELFILLYPNSYQSGGRIYEISMHPNWGLKQ